jgi:hypothetical protein
MSPDLMPCIAHMYADMVDTYLPKQAGLISIYKIRLGIYAQTMAL